MKLSDAIVSAVKTVQSAAADGKITGLERLTIAGAGLVVVNSLADEVAPKLADGKLDGGEIAALIAKGLREAADVVETLVPAAKHNDSGTEVA
jgi:hypothetical protein